MERRWVRPLLCRLCECPVAEGGVPLSHIDRPKLSEWWLKHLDTELDEEDSRDAWICQFCIWDARFEHENSVNIQETDHVWWSIKQRYDNIYEEYYKGELIKPCCVKIEGPHRSPLETTSSDSPHNQQIGTITRRSQTRTGVHYEKPSEENSKCIYCSKKVKHLRHHVRKVHPKSYINCPQTNCGSYFTSNAEKDEHVLRVHASNKTTIKCVYCGFYMPDHKSQWSHMKTKHKDEAIRCPYRHCPTFLRSLEDEQIHVKEVHEKADKVRCIYCDIMFVPDSMQLHIRFIHSDVAIKCNYNRNCPSYFKNLEQRDQHIREQHQVERFKRKITCLICKRELAQSGFRSHMRFVHRGVAIKCNDVKCTMYFKSAEERDEHFREKHEEQDQQKRLKCQHCDYKTNKVDCFNQHVSLKHGTENLPCPQCPGKIYKSQLALRRHIHLIHSEKMVCSHCGIACAKFAMRKHRQNDFCTLCSKKIMCVGMMNFHKTKCQDVGHGLARKLLAAKKNFKFHCDLCKTSHKSRGKLIVHMKNVHGHSNKLFQCSACKKQFMCGTIRDGHRCRPFGRKKSM